MGGASFSVSSRLGLKTFNKINDQDAIELSITDFEVNVKQYSEEIEAKRVFPKLNADYLDLSDPAYNLLPLARDLKEDDETAELYYCGNKLIITRGSEKITKV